MNVNSHGHNLDTRFKQYFLKIKHPPGIKNPVGLLHPESIKTPRTDMRRQVTAGNSYLP
jgi:hypothetical protein